MARNDTQRYSTNGRFEEFKSPSPTKTPERSRGSGCLPTAERSTPSSIVGEPAALDVGGCGVVAVLPVQGGERVVVLALPGFSRDQ